MAFKVPDKTHMNQKVCVITSGITVVGEVWRSDDILNGTGTQLNMCFQKLGFSH